MSYRSGHVHGRRRSPWPVLMTAVVCTAGLVMAGAVWSAPAHAAVTTQSAPTDPNVFVACGYGGGSTGGDTCDSLPQALAKVLASNLVSTPAATIELRPGRYCPLDLTAAATTQNNRFGIVYRTITIAGMGHAGYLDDTEPIAFEGPEAALSSFRWSSTYCQGAQGASAYLHVDNGDWPNSRVILRNLAVDGDPDGVAAGAPKDGIAVDETSLFVRDVLVEHLTAANSAGLRYSSGANTSLSATNSAFVDNAGVGVGLNGVGSVRNSTVAGNAGEGLSLSQASAATLINDTVTHNGTGIYSAGDYTIANSIVADNTTTTSEGTSTTTDCGGRGWEAGAGGSGYNLAGSTCVPDTENKNDVVADNITVGAIQEGADHPTPYFQAPLEALGRAAPGWCGSTDQRETRPADGVTACDIGSVDSTGGNAAPSAHVDDEDLDLGRIQVGESTGGQARLYADTGSVAVGDVSLDDPDGAFTLSPRGNSCSLSTLVPALSCTVGVQAAPPSVGTFHAVLTIKTDAGNVPARVNLTVAGVLPPPSALTVTRTTDPDGDGTCLGGQGDDCSLRQAVAAIAPGGTITVPAGTYTLTQGSLEVGEPMAIRGAGARTTTVTRDADTDSDSIVRVNDSHGVTVSGMTLTGGGGGDGGRRGGGVYAADSVLTLDAVRVTGNSAEYNGGGVYSLDGQLTVTGSTIDANTLTSGDSGGAGIALDSSSLTMTNSTISGNNAAYDDGGAGGGVYLVGASQATITFSTIAKNLADASAGIMDYSSSGQEDALARRPLVREDPPVGVTIADSVLAGNTAANGPGDCGSTTLTSGGHNYVSDPNTSDQNVPCGLTDPSDVHSGDVQLATLADNGGPTDTMLPAATSSLVDAASDSDCENVTNDQRGISRPQGDSCDIGAVEAEQQETPPTTPPVSPPTTTPPAPPSTAPPAPPSSTPPPVHFVAAGPTRVLDTRTGTGAAAGPLGPQGSITLTVPNLPAGTTAVVLNLTGTGLTGAPATYVSACPAAQALSACTATSALNLTGGVAVANMLIVPVGPDGKITLYNNAGTVDLVADLLGYETGGYTATGPTRVLDIRTGRGALRPRIGARQSITLTIPDLPAGTTAVVLNLTGTNLTGAPATFVSACPAAMPLTTCTKTSVLNAVPRVDVSNEITVPVGPDGKITLYNNAGTIALLADLAGYHVGGYAATGPTRILDTRTGIGAPAAAVGAKSTITLTVPSLPAGTNAVVLNLTGTRLTDAAATYVSACPAAMPLSACTKTSALNVISGVDVANEVTVPVGPDGKIVLYNNAGTMQIVADLVGYAAGG